MSAEAPIKPGAPPPSASQALAEALASVLAEALASLQSVERLLTVKELAARWSMTPWYVRELISKQAFPVIRFGYKELRIRQSVADKWARDRETYKQRKTA